MIEPQEEKSLNWEPSIVIKPPAVWDIPNNVPYSNAKFLKALFITYILGVSKLKALVCFLIWIKDAECIDGQTIDYLIFVLQTDLIVTPSLS